MGGWIRTTETRRSRAALALRQRSYSLNNQNNAQRGLHALAVSCVIVWNVCDSHTHASSRSYCLRLRRRAQEVEGELRARARSNRAPLLALALQGRTEAPRRTRIQPAPCFLIALASQISANARAPHAMRASNQGELATAMAAAGVRDAPVAARMAHHSR